MLLEDLLSLPAGTQVAGKIQVLAKVSGVVVSLENGCRFIRWEDGYSTIPLGKVRKYDEYIAAHTELVNSRAERVCHPETVGDVYQSKTQTEADDLVAQG